MMKYKNNFFTISLFLVSLILLHNFNTNDSVHSKKEDNMILSDENITRINDEQAEKVFYREREKFENITNYIINNELNVNWQINMLEDDVDVVSNGKSVFIEDKTVKSDIVYLFKEYNIYHIIGGMPKDSGYTHNYTKFYYYDTNIFLYNEDTEYSEQQDNRIKHLDGYWYLEFLPYT